MNARTHPAALVLGLGNELASDDGFGPAVAHIVRDRLGDEADVVIESGAFSALDVLARIGGFEDVVIVDAVRTGRHPPGEVFEWPVSRIATMLTPRGWHNLALDAALALADAVGGEHPRSIWLLVAEARDLTTWHEGLTPEVAAVVPRAAALVVDHLRHSRRGRGPSHAAVA